MIRLVGQKPGQTASDIATMLGKHPSTLTGVLARLEERELIVREIDPRRSPPRALQATQAARRSTANAGHRRGGDAPRARPRRGSTAVETTLELVAKLVEELERED